MKNFLAIYIGSSSSAEKAQNKISNEIEKAGMESWGQWIAKNSNSIIDFGTPLGKTKRISPQGVSNHINKMTGYIIVKAETHEAAAKMFEKHPHFTIFPGDSVEVMECLQLPVN